MNNSSTDPTDRRLEVLVLDDEEIVCTRLKPMLAKWGYKAETYLNSIEARDRIDEHFFDIIVTDLKMASMDGMQLFKFAKKRWPDTEVVIITGFATIDVALQALREGVREILAKPFKVKQLKEILDRIAEEKAAAGPEQE